MIMATKKKSTNKKEIKKELKEEVRKIRPKNYLILGAIFLVTLALVFLLRYWYISYQNYKLSIPVLKDTLMEITHDELDHYITANPDAVIYIEVSEDENSREVAKDLKEVIKKRNLANKVVYLNISSIEDKDAFFTDFSKKYLKEDVLTNYPALVLFLDGKIDAYVSKTNRQKLNIGDIAQIFDQYELEGDN
jgi:hypothetical protein